MIPASSQVLSCARQGRGCWTQVLGGGVWEPHLMISQCSPPRAQRSVTNVWMPLPAPDAGNAATHLQRVALRPREAWGSQDV